MTDGLSPAVAGHSGEDSVLAKVSPRTASQALYAALATLLLSAVAIALFFGGAGGIFGPINDLLVATTVVLLSPSVVVIQQLARGRVGRWFTAVGVGAVVGIAIMALGQLALVVGLIDLEMSFATGTVGVLLAIAWIAGVAITSLRHDVVAHSVGWWAAAFVVAAIVTSIAVPLVSLDTPTLSLVFGGPLLVTLVGWMLSLARDLARR